MTRPDSVISRCSSDQTRSISPIVISPVLLFIFLIRPLKIFHIHCGFPCTISWYSRKGLNLETFVLVPCGYLCPVGTCALWVLVPCGYLCPVGTCALWVLVPCGCLCPVGACALWVLVPCGYLCPVGACAKVSIDRSAP